MNRPIALLVLCATVEDRFAATASKRTQLLAHIALARRGGRHVNNTTARRRLRNKEAVSTGLNHLARHHDLTNFPTVMGM